MNCPFKFDCFQQTYICRHLLFHRLVKKEALFEKEMMPRRFWSLNTQEERTHILIEESRGEVEEDTENEEMDSRGDGSPGREVFKIYLLYTFFAVYK